MYHTCNKAPVVPVPDGFPEFPRGFSGRGFRSPEVGDSGIRFRKISRKFLSMLRSKNARFSISVGENRGECRISPGKYDFPRRYSTFPEFPRIPGPRGFPRGDPRGPGIRGVGFPAGTGTSKTVPVASLVPIISFLPRAHETLAPTGTIAKQFSTFPGNALSVDIRCGFLIIIIF